MITECSPWHRFVNFISQRNVLSLNGNLISQRNVFHLQLRTEFSLFSDLRQIALMYLKVVIRFDGLVLALIVCLGYLKVSKCYCQL